MRNPIQASARTIYSMEHSITHANDEMLASDMDRDMARTMPRAIWRVIAVTRNPDGSVTRIPHLGFFNEAECDAAMDGIKANS